jgi:thiol-disulfide isomerase/thioredoxin
MRPFFIGLVVVAIAAAEAVAPGAKAPEFKLTDLKGAPVAIERAADRPTVAIFISTQCPVSNAYNQRMSALYRDYSGRVRFVFINSNGDEAAPQVEQHRTAVGFPFVVYKDVGNSTADAFGAQLTPEAFVMDASGTVRYHGAIDDQRNPVRVRVPGLRLAIDAVLKDAKVDPEQTRAFGCTIKRARHGS